MARKKQTKSKKPLNQDRATVSLIFGVASVITFFFWFLGLVFGVLAIVFSAAALKAKQDAGRAVAGMTLGIAGLLLSVVVMIILTIAAPKVQESQADTYRDSEMASLSMQINTIVSDGKKASVEPSDLSLQGFTVIKSVSASEPATKTNVHFTSGRFCDGAVGQNDYSVTVLMGDGTPYCSGYKQD